MDVPLVSRSENTVVGIFEFCPKTIDFFSLLIVCMIQYDNKGIFWLEMVIDDSFMYLNNKKKSLM